MTNKSLFWGGAVVAGALIGGGLLLWKSQGPLIWLSAFVAYCF